MRLYYCHLHRAIISLLQMPRLSGHIKSSIVALRKAHFSWTAICKQLNVKPSSARSVVKKFDITGTVDNKPVSGRPKKISPQGERRLVRLAISNRFSSARCLLEIWNEGLQQNVRIGLTTARLILKKYNIRGCTAAKTLKLAKNTRKVRRK